MNSIAAAIRRTPLEQWIAHKLHCKSEALTREAIKRYQLFELKKTLEWARRRSSFYAQHLAKLPKDPIRSLDDLCYFPFTTAEDIAQSPGRFLCVAQDEIRRIVTLSTSGTGGSPKRIFFTAEDLELALDFFEHGVSSVAAPGEGMLIALPGEREGSVGYQLAKGIARARVIPIPYGLSHDPAQMLAALECEQAASIIGLPIQILSLAYHSNVVDSSIFRNLRSIVLCSDHVPSSLVQAIRQRTRGEVFEHYGMTEMGLGGGIDCGAHAGYHLREADFYFEIVDRETGQPVAEGEEGEIVFTTLTRRGMPLIRYRTGDISRFLPDPCLCGTVLRRLERMRNRVDSNIPLGDCGDITLAMLDEALFSVQGIVDFRATVTLGDQRKMDLLLYSPVECEEPSMAQIVNALNTIETIRRGRRSSEVEIVVNVTHNPVAISNGKRRIEVFENR